LTAAGEERTRDLDLTLQHCYKDSWQVCSDLRRLSCDQLCVCRQCRRMASASSSRTRVTTAVVLGDTSSSSTNVCTVAYSNSSDCYTSDTICNVAADSTTTLFSARLAARRPHIPKLETLRHSSPHSSPTLVSTVPQSTTEQFASSRAVNISFNELSYTVKTGIKRGTF
jgi:hypothetical protein